MSHNLSWWKWLDFNPRAPRGARQEADGTVITAAQFQSTCPARGTTGLYRHRLSRFSDFNPRAPRGARHQYKWRTLQKTTISIHVPREGHDSTSPTKYTLSVSISIHVPREGHDPRPPMHRIKGTDFNPRAPRGARPTPLNAVSSWSRFQSTCPARGTTSSRPVPALYSVNFNPRAPRGARQVRPAFDSRLITHFNPRAPRGARQQTCTIFSCRFAQELQISR